MERQPGSKALEKKLEEIGTSPERDGRCQYMMEGSSRDMFWNYGKTAGEASRREKGLKGNSAVWLMIDLLRGSCTRESAATIGLHYSMDG